jgi:hypothetical protein
MIAKSQQLVTSYENTYRELAFSVRELGDIIGDAFSSQNFDSLNRSFEQLARSLDFITNEALFDFMKRWDQVTSREQIAKMTEMAAQLSLMTTSIIGGVFDAEIQKESDLRNEKYTQDTAALRKELDDRLISQEDYDSKLKALDAQKRVAEKLAKQEAFRAQKRLSIVNATMSTAAGVAAALTVPPPAGQILAATNAALGATQIGIISSQEFRARRGGQVPKNGMSGDVDSVKAVLAPGEMVINSRSSEMFPEMLSAINQMGGGIALTPTMTALNPSSVGTKSIGQTREDFHFNIKASVVEQDMTSTQNRIERMKRNGNLFKK